MNQIVPLSLAALCMFVVDPNMARAESPEPASTTSSDPGTFQKADLSVIDNGLVRVGIDANKGGAITWISSKSYPKNLINHADPGRLIQQSYYAGKALDRMSEGQSKAWSPWTWNPIQGGGVGSWAKAKRFEQTTALELYSESTPKLWDMPNEDAQAVMRQWTSFEKDMPATIKVRCQFQSMREDADRWGETSKRPQEVPACYFVRSFMNVKSYLGDGTWHDHVRPPGPPWSKTKPPLNAMAMFNDEGQGIALFSPAATEHWNFGPHSTGDSDDPRAKPCMHVAPISLVPLAPQSLYEYRYWLVVGDQETIETNLDTLIEKYAGEQATLVDSSNKKGK